MLNLQPPPDFGRSLSFILRGHRSLDVVARLALALVFCFAFLFSVPSIVLAGLNGSGSPANLLLILPWLLFVVGALVWSADLGFHLFGEEAILVQASGVVLIHRFFSFARTRTIPRGPHLVIEVSVAREFQADPRPHPGAAPTFWSFGHGKIAVSYGFGQARVGSGIADWRAGEIVAEIYQVFPEFKPEPQPPASSGRRPR